MKLKIPISRLLLLSFLLLPFTLFSQDVLVGTTSYSIYAISDDGTTTIHSSTLGTRTTKGGQFGKTLIYHNDKLWGVAKIGGTNDEGIIFSLAIDGTGFTILHHFDGTNGGKPIDRVFAINNKIVGLTSEGGTSDKGVLFSMNEDGTGYSVLEEFSKVVGGSLSFENDQIWGVLSGEEEIFSIDADGNNYNEIDLTGFDDSASSGGGLKYINSKIYGTLSASSSNGSLFSIDTDGTNYSELADADSETNLESSPGFSLIASNSKVFGVTTSSDGTIFSMDVDGSNLAKLHDFVSGTGVNPASGLTEYDGKLWGITSGGGNNGEGVIFTIDTDGTNYSVEEHISESQIGGEVQGMPIIFSTETTWDGSSWTNGEPSAFKTIVIDSDFTPTSDFTCAALTITSGNSLNIASGRTITVQGDITNNGDGITGSGILVIDGFVNVTENLSINPTLSITSGNSLSISSGKALTLSGGLSSIGNGIGGSGSLLIDFDFTLSSDITFGDIGIASGHEINIPTGRTLTLQGDITNSGDGITGEGTLEIDANVEVVNAITVQGIVSITSGNQLTTNNNLTLEDGATLYHSSTGQISGNVNVKRTGETSNKIYNYWSVPVQEGAQASQVVDRDRYYYDEPSSTWQAFSGSVSVGQGIIATGAGTFTITGTPYADAVNVPVTSQSANATFKGYNLIGNVFLAPLDYDLFIADNGNITNGTLYFYEGNSDGTGAYTVVNSSNKLDIPSFQGFFVHVAADGNITFEHDQKQTEKSGSVYRKNQNTPFEKFTFEAISDLYSDKVVFLTGADFTDEDDYTFDAFKLNGSQALSLKFNRDETDYHTLALEKVDQYMLPITLAFDKTKTVNLELQEKQLLEDYEIYLFDKTNENKFNLNDEVVLTGEGTEEDRYEIHISKIIQTDPGNSDDIISSIDLEDEVETTISIVNSKILIDQISNGDIEIIVTTTLGTKLYQSQSKATGGKAEFNYSIPTNTPVIIQLLTSQKYYSYKVLINK
ncbi:choice-of-anchor tandem repeat GloVer-containing protein [Flammeovirga sp. OC4]|uniref:choice-of-anchor tandem repeat GloVer-containing protein n=1 Tax=Flammeovirga sp. OC4 TaxID=1382345 RepID=UPI0005C6E364|nr:choice-of-anchor tandem repeat GloVer-containing protein [Flammeovirga sp. OC4]